MDSLTLSVMNDVLESRRRNVLDNVIILGRYSHRFGLGSSTTTVPYVLDSAVGVKCFTKCSRISADRRTFGSKSRTRCVSSDVSGNFSEVKLAQEFDERSRISFDAVAAHPCTFREDLDASSKRNSRGGRRHTIWTRLLKIKRTNSHRSSVAQEHDVRSVRDTNGGPVLLPFVDPSCSKEKCNSILSRLQKFNGTKALQFFEMMKDNGQLKKNIDAYKIMFQLVAEKEDWVGADSLLQGMTTVSECMLTAEIFNILLKACFKRDLVSSATKWFHIMLRERVRPNASTIGLLMSLYQKGNCLPEAEFAFEKMREHKLKCVKGYSAMITICTRLRLYAKSEEIIGLMKEDGVSPNTENWLVQLNAYSQQGKLREAELLLESMQDAGEAPNIVAYNTLITGYGKVSDMNSAQRVYCTLQSIGLVPDETTNRSMIEGYGREGNYREALAYYKKIKASGFFPSSSNFYTMLNLQARHADDESAITTVEDMIAAGCQYASILGILVQAYNRVGRVDAVLRILEASCYEHILGDATSCSVIVMAFVKHSLLADAVQVLCDKKWEDHEFEDNLYHLLICSCKEAGNLDFAIKIFNQMLKSGRPLNMHIACSMIDAYSSMLLFSEAENIYLLLKKSDFDLDMIGYSIVARMYIKAERLVDACSIFEVMEKQKDIIPDKYLFCDMLRTYQRCNRLDKLADTYYWICRSGIQWDEAFFNCVINCCGRAIPVDELSRIFDEMIQLGHSASTFTFNIMLDVYGKAHLFSKAQKVFLMACKLGLVDIVSYNTIIAAYGQAKDYKSMDFYIQRMQNDGYPISLEVYNCLLDAYGKDDRLEEFNDVLEKMKEARCSFDHYTCNIMINIYGKKGWIEEVAMVLSELKNRGSEPDLYGYNSLIKAYGIAGMTEDAVNVVHEIRSKGLSPDRVTFANLIKILQRNGDFLEAVKWSLWMKQMGRAI